MQSFYHDWPKAELHLHLEGSIEPWTLRELNPATTLEEARQHYVYADFAGFIHSYLWVIGHLTEPAHYALVARRLLERLAREGVRYAEIMISAGVILWRHQEFAPIYDALEAEAAQSKVRVRWVMDAVRQWGVEEARKVLRLAAERVGKGVVAFGIGGDESRGPAEWFGDVFKEAREAGLHLTIHAGETVGPESVWNALKVGAERIGHGIAAASDRALLAHLRERNIPLEVCLSSNVATGAVRSLEEHPVRRIFEAGVPMVLGTDDPAMFHTTLEREYDLAAQHFGFSEAELEALTRNGFRYAFDWKDEP